MDKVCSFDIAWNLQQVNKVFFGKYLKVITIFVMLQKVLSVCV